MQLTDNKNIKILAGNKKFKKQTFKIFDEEVCNFLETLSNEILKDNNALKYSDLIAFAFWIRKKNIYKKKSKYLDQELRLGYGLAFHITPANVALQFAYSFVISLISGNSNIIRVTNVKFEQNKIFFKILNKIMKINKFKKIYESNLFLNYDYNEKTNETLSKICDCRIVWGSDKTISNIKKIPTRPLCKDIMFPDRYSIAVINLNTLSKLSKKNFIIFVKKFYQDALVFDQNACSSPHLIFWFGKKNKLKIYNKFWDQLNLTIKNGKFFVPNEKNKIDKFTKICEYAASRDEVKKVYNDSYSSRIEINKIPKDITSLRVGFGFFFEHFTNDFKDIVKSVSSKFQTMTYFGFKEADLKKFILEEKPLGIDRIVPVGRALEFDQLWDGYDLIRSMSKVIDLK